MADNYDPIPDLAEVLAAVLADPIRVNVHADRIAEQLGLGEDDSAEVVAAELRKALGDDRLRAENAALRDLLTAASTAADVPLPANDGDMQVHYLTCARRADLIAIHARAHQSLNVVRSRTERLNAEAARPLRYTPRETAR